MRYSAFLLVSVCIISLSCDKSESETDPTQYDKLVQTWTLTDGGYVKASGVLVTDQYTDLSFTFRADNTYSTVVNGKTTEGVWRATDSSVSTIILDDLTPVNVLELTNQRLLVSFTHEGMINARTKGLSLFEVLFVVN